MIVLDTTVLVYAVGAAHRLREPCQRIVAAIGDGRVAATTTVEVIQVFVHVRARRRRRADASSLAKHYVDLLKPLLRPSERDLGDGLAMFEQTPSLGAFDAVLAATALNADAQALVSADVAFADVPGLTHVDPGDTDQLATVV